MITYSFFRMYFLRTYLLKMGLFTVNDNVSGIENAI